MNSLNYYVVGGMYERAGMPDKVFGLMHPSGIDIPYITNNPNSSTLRIGAHTRALYRYDADKQILVKQPDVHYEQDPDRKQPNIVIPTDHILDIIRDAIEKRITYID
ncbi:hypothetical protein [Butyrivibrio sp.]|uniref:hypothetical protein n=1 Tax=Butyrivibrio sp. TaxID=28121 RepID=UPI0025B9E802|nr:hypothetical protein [Butyrivibrio sp.]MBQ7431282.1 hypothetical protein [Butyrivibrio sp.]MBQ9303497.1 hypothetical protein [Butyrivibrio sp.]